nr:uncharacterized protein LOC101242009 isoform X1 [Ciona intestinalis]|eukprot:XP_026691977.1 uncharacterized protein LOC101242009 isoform X1 [Ciona intestinalis]
MINQEKISRTSVKNTKLFHCIGERKYIPVENQCDGNFDCTLLSDECLCEKSPAICQDICYNRHNNSNVAGEPCFQCPFGEIKCTDRCISREKVCDGKADCSNANDENFCTSAVQCAKGNGSICSPSFQCHTSGTTNIPGFIGKRAHLCDGQPQCIHFEDECSSELCSNPLPEYCHHVSLLVGIGFYYRCKEGGVFLKGPQVCDGFSRDCPDGDDELNCPNRTYCQNLATESSFTGEGQIHISTTQICDGVIDCQNKQDEMNCSQHYYCTGGEPFFIPIRFIADGKADCLDSSDECPPDSFQRNIFASREEMIKSPVLRYLVWIIGGLSIAGNVTVLFETFYGLLWSDERFRNKRPFAKVNHVLVINLALADLLMGVYLLLLGTEAAWRSGSYCKDDKSWRSSDKCGYLGALTVVSCLASVSILLLLTSYRLYGVFWPFRSQRVNYKTTMLFAISAWLIALLLAFIPLSPLVSYHYTSHLWISHNPYFTSDVVERDALLQFCRRFTLYQDVHQNQSHEVAVEHSKIWLDNTWNVFGKTIVDKIGSFRGEFGYYSVHSVCMPKLYVTTKDVAWRHSMIIIFFNFFSILYILAAYLLIALKSKKRVTKYGNSMSSRHSSMFRRITYLVISDIACWLPVCTMAFMNISGYKISENAYAVSAVVLLPINSALNPLLYSNAVQHLLIKLSCGKRTMQRNPTSTTRIENPLHQRGLRLGKIQHNETFNRNNGDPGNTRLRIPDVIPDQDGKTTSSALLSTSM